MLKQFEIFLCFDDMYTCADNQIRRLLLGLLNGNGERAWWLSALAMVVKLALLATAKNHAPSTHHSTFNAAVSTFRSPDRAVHGRLIRIP